MGKVIAGTEQVTSSFRGLQEDFRKNQEGRLDFEKTMMKGLESRVDTLNQMLGPLVVGHLADSSYSAKREIERTVAKTGASELGKDLFRSRSRAPLKDDEVELD